MGEFSRVLPAQLGAPLQVLFWETDDLLLMMMAFIVAMITDLWWCYLGIIVLPMAYGRMKMSRPKGFLRHMLYYGGFISMKGYPIYYDKDFQE